jgi:hypothetical protein
MKYKIVKKYNYADSNGLVNANVDDWNVNDTFQNTDATYYNITSNIFLLYFFKYIYIYIYIKEWQ